MKVFIVKMDRTNLPQQVQITEEEIQSAIVKIFDYELQYQIAQSITVMEICE